METPSSTRRVTRSQTLSTTKTSGTKLNQERSALFDITNDSPIIGVAMQKTPSSGVVLKRNIKNTPGSGETLLRGQVKNLLQKVEEGADLTKISIESRPPFRLLAPTPTNTPQVLDFFSDGLQIVITSPVVASQVEESNMFEKKEESLRLEKSPSINRSLLLDFSDKSEICDNSKDEEEEVYSYKEEDDEYYEEEEEEVDGLCEGMKKMNVEAEFAGKHTRFVYNSEDEEEEIVVVEEREDESPRVFHLKGVPTPGAKHDRFEDDDE